MEDGGKYLLPSCSRDHQVGEPILFYGNPAPPLGAYNSRRVPEGATQRNRFRGNKKSGGIRIKGFILKRMDGERRRKKQICREILRDEIYISDYVFAFLLIVLSVFVKRCNISCTTVQKCCKTGIESSVIQGVPYRF